MIMMLIYVSEKNILRHTLVTGQHYSSLGRTCVGAGDQGEPRPVVGEPPRGWAPGLGPQGCGDLGGEEEGIYGKAWVLERCRGCPCAGGTETMDQRLAREVGCG